MTMTEGEDDALDVLLGCDVSASSCCHGETHDVRKVREYMHICDETYDTISIPEEREANKIGNNYLRNRIADRACIFDRDMLACLR
jgi:hypothetical protein